MPETWEGQAVEAQAAEQPQAAHEEASALAVSVDDFAALEERVHRTVDLVKREREARKAAETRAAELDARAVQAEAQVQAQSPKVEQLQSELGALRAEREQVRQRVERLLKQLDALEI
ncbi:MAG: hypothetical protein ACLQG3_02640 [Terracidiphilus sp.]